jgi:CheY-like chemotaxis protein
MAAGVQPSLPMARQRRRVQRAPFVLVVDDNADLRELYATYFSSQGLRTATAADGVKGLAQAREDPPDMIIADLSLPHLDGWEMTRRLKRDPRTAHIPVIACTGHAYAGSPERALDAGCDAYVLKPCLPDALLGEIQRVLASRSLSRSA